VTLNEKEEAAPQLARAVHTLHSSSSGNTTPRHGPRWVQQFTRIASVAPNTRWTPRGCATSVDVVILGRETEEQNHNRQRKLLLPLFFPSAIRIPRGCVTLSGCQQLLAEMLAGPTNPEVESGTTPLAWVHRREE